MATLDEKRLGLIYSLMILYNYSDADNRLTQDKVREYLEKDYGFESERKAVGRALNLLAEVEAFGVVNDRGYYIEKRLFTDAQLRMLTDIVLSSSYISKNNAKEIIESLKKLGSAKFKSRIRNTCFVEKWNRTENDDLYIKLDIIDSAIDKGRTIKFTYTKFNYKGERVVTSNPVVSPYQLIVKNQRYYLFSHNETHNDFVFYHIDRMIDLEFSDVPYTDIRQTEQFRGGIDYDKISMCLPYPFGDKMVKVEFTIPAGYDMENEVYASFGKNADFTRKGDKRYVRVLVSRGAMKHWALNYLDKVEIIKPEDLRDEMKGIVSAAYTKYNN